MYIMNRYFKRSVLICFLFAIAGNTIDAQTGNNTDLASFLNDSGSAAKKEYVTATFKATRIINGSSVENLGAGILDFRIMHRFGDLSQGGSNFYGIDNATTKVALDYGIRPWLMVGLGHSTYEKMDDGFAKIKLLRQQLHGMPFSLSYQGSISVITEPNPAVPAGDTYYFTNKLSYVHQVLIARKFNEYLSLQLMPTLVHYNLVDSNKYKNDVLAVGAGGRIKITKRIAITGEYYWVVPGTEQYFINSSGVEERCHNAASIGVDIETGGHVFQLHFTNATAMTESEFIGHTQNDLSKGQMHLGFNISRVFTINKPKEFRHVSGASN